MQFTSHPRSTAMAGASDKARFYLEQSIPELQEFGRKKIFTKVGIDARAVPGSLLTYVQEEITSIAKKRSEFEHVLNARGSHPSDYARYAEYEMNLEALRRKRVQRLNIKSSGHAGQRRIFFVLDRATRKFHGDMGLWMQYIEYARKEKANKKLAQILTSVLRMHPTKPELWIYAARYAMDSEADITAARSYMQRGLRFCANSTLLWLEYARLETMYVAKIAARRHILGLDSDRSKEQQNTASDDPNADVVALPDVTAEDINPSLAKDDGVDETALENLAATPVLTGAIPMAVFDAAMKQFPKNVRVAEQFFDVFAEFDKTPCTRRILEHAATYMLKSFPGTVPAIVCGFKLPLTGTDPSSAELPAALGRCLDNIKSSMKEFPQLKREIAEKAAIWILPFTHDAQLDPDIRRVASSTLRQWLPALEETRREAEAGSKVADIVLSLQREGRLEDADSLLSIGLKRYGSNERLLQTRSSLGSGR